jgi:putative hemin transport protein
MALTRNAHCVHERQGRYNPPEFHGAMGQVVGEIDLRVFSRHWAFAYALTEQTHKTARRSIQIFDETGEAVHKVYPTEATNLDAFDALIAEQADFDAVPAAFVPPPGPERARPDAEIDALALRADWAALEHSHDFFSLLRKHGVTRAQAMRLGGPDLARPVSPAAAQAVLDRGAATALPLMIFVGNRGCVQIHSGPVETIKVTGPWLNVLDPRFNLHLRWDRIAAAWVVRKPSLRGDVHSLELYDAEGFCFCQIFGERKPGESEREDWRRLTAELEAAAPC